MGLYCFFDDIIGDYGVGLEGYQFRVVGCGELITKWYYF